MYSTTYLHNYHRTIRALDQFIYKSTYLSPYFPITYLYVHFCHPICVVHISITDYLLSLSEYISVFVLILLQYCISCGISIYLPIIVVQFEYEILAEACRGILIGVTLNFFAPPARSFLWCHT